MLAPAARLEVHEQEGEVRAHVDRPQPVVELDAVEDGDALAEEDVLGAQVAVAVADAAARRARDEPRAPVAQRSVEEAPASEGTRVAGSEQAGKLVERSAGGRPLVLERTRRRLCDVACRRVERGEAAAHARVVVQGQRAALEP